MHDSNEPQPSVFLHYLHTNIAIVGKGISKQHAHRSLIIMCMTKSFEVDLRSLFLIYTCRMSPFRKMPPMQTKSSHVPVTIKTGQEAVASGYQLKFGENGSFE
jgi:hypothetical protein